jgi:hypothetical protein
MGMQVRGKHLLDSFARLPQRALPTAGIEEPTNNQPQSLSSPSEFLVFFFLRETSPGILLGEQ